MIPPVMWVQAYVKCFGFASMLVGREESRAGARKPNTGTHPLTFIGELFSANALTRVATAAQFQAKVHKPAFENYVKTVIKLIDANHPALCRWM